jgi:hypothetical protein
MKHFALVVTVVLMLAACGSAVEDGDTTTTAVADVPTTQTTTAPETTTTPPTTTTETTDTDEPTETPTTGGDLMNGQVPDELMADIVADIIDRTGAAESELILVRAESAIWNDGSLGCPVPGQSYTQALVDGYWVVIEHAELEYDYRASSTGFFVLCEGGGSPPTNPTG